MPNIPARQQGVFLQAPGHQHTSTHFITLHGTWLRDAVGHDAAGRTLPWRALGQASVSKCCRPLTWLVRTQERMR